MKAMQLISSTPGPQLVLADIPRPKPGLGEVLIQVYAAGVITTELQWYPTTHTVHGDARLAAVPGHEFSGIIAELGDGVESFTIRQEVFGMNDWFQDGATAEYCITRPEWIAPQPHSMPHNIGATIPISALTAWQGLFTKANLQPGERILVQGGSGAVGLFAVQFAHRHGATVIATASEENAPILTELGAAQVIDYKATRFEDQVHDVDVVFDTVGGETLRRSSSVLRSGGRLVTISSDAEAMTEPHIKEAFFIVVPDGPRLAEIARMLEAGELKTYVKAVVPMEEAQAAYTNTLAHTAQCGKVVIEVHHEA